MRLGDRGRSGQLRDGRTRGSGRPKARLRSPLAVSAASGGRGRTKVGRNERGARVDPGRLLDVGPSIDRSAVVRRRETIQSGEKMTKLKVVVALLAAALMVAPGAFAADGPKNKDNDTHVQLLAINDFHGHLEPNTPGTIRYCCEFDANPTVNRNVVVTRPAGGVEYLATEIKSLRERNTNTITVGAGDMIGASPLLSGLFHDEPSIEALNALGLQVTGVGNHEFDEGLQELYRMQNGGCTSDTTTCALMRNGRGGPFG